MTERKKVGPLELRRTWEFARAQNPNTRSPVLTKIFRCLLALATLFLLTSPAQSEWFASVPPKPGDTAVATAGSAPADSALVLAWNLKGQIDIAGDLAKARRVLQAGTDEDIFQSLEHVLKRSPEEIFGYFSGAGYISLKEKSLSAETSPIVIVGLALEDSEGLSSWLQEMLAEERRAQIDGFQLYLEQEDDFTLGFDRQWLFFAFGKGSRSYALDAFKGDSPQLKTLVDFRQAFADLGYRESGAAVYMKESFYPSLLNLTASVAGISSPEAPPLWEYGAGAINFKTETGDLFLKLSGDSPAALALGAPGGVTGSFLKKVPNGLSSYLALDMAWYGNVLEAVTAEYAPLNSAYDYARTTLNSIGDVTDAFSGPVFIGSDLFDRLRPNSQRPTVLALAEIKNPDEAHRILLNLSQSEAIDQPSDTQDYETAQGFKARLDRSHKELYVVYGPDSEDFLDEAAHHSGSPHALVEETLDWSDGELAILAFFDLEEFVEYWKSCELPGEARITREFCREFLGHSRLQGVLAIKSGPEGVHYKLRGLACSPLIPAAFIGAFTLSGIKAFSPPEALNSPATSEEADESQDLDQD